MSNFFFDGREYKRNDVKPPFKDNNDTCPKDTPQKIPRPPARKKTAWWFLLPIVMGVIGGIIAYVILRHEDYTRGRDCMILGVLLTGIWGVIEIAMMLLGRPAGM